MKYAARHNRAKSAAPRVRSAVFIAARKRPAGPHGGGRVRGQERKQHIQRDLADSG